jgi:hypothetical protein
MKPKQIFVWLAGCVLLAVAEHRAAADAKINPYDPIVERNPFGLKPPPPPPDPNEAPKTPPAPPATVELTGITSILTSKRALLEIVPGPGKPMLKPILGEGERIESVEVVSINVEKNEVTIRNGTLVTNLTFKVAKSTPTPVAPVPGMVPPPVAPPPPAAAAQPVQTSYNNYQNNTGSGRNSVMVSGGNSDATAASTTPAYGGVNPAVGGGLTPTGTPALNSGGFRQIPSRSIRTPSTPQGQPAMSPQQQFEEIEKNRALNYLNSQITGRPSAPLPPTPITPPDAPGVGPRFNPVPPPPLPE